MGYDHHKKAGNQGDVVKHVALIAALNVILDNHSERDFHYADTFAGYAQNPLVPGNGWEQGIGKIFAFEELKNNQYVVLWHRWYLSGRPQLLAGTYPGSSLIASDVCTFKKKRGHFALWDISPEVIQNLVMVFGGQEEYAIYTCPAIPDDPDVKNADFVFIDPPGIGKGKECLGWECVLPFLLSEKKSQAVLLWLAINADTTRKPPGEGRQSRESRNDAIERGYAITKIRWATGGRTIGCQLIYRVPEKAAKALRDAVSHVVSVAGWQNALPNDVIAVNHYPEEI